MIDHIFSCMTSDINGELTKCDLSSLPCPLSGIAPNIQFKLKHFYELTFPLSYFNI